MNPGPRIVLTLLCRDEADIVAANVEFHLSCGVDFIIATDNASNDGTTEILRHYERRNLLRLLHEPEHTHDQAIWVTRMAHLATHEHAADWLIHADADEFWCPTEGSLRDTLRAIPKHVTALDVGRTNFLPPAVGSEDCLPFFQRQVIRETCSLNSLGRPLPPKVCHRSHPNIHIDDGNHSILRDGQPVAALPTDRIKILHFPIRSLAQLERKITQGAQALERNARVDKSIGSTWRHLYKIMDREGSLIDYYESLCLTPKQIADGVAAGALVEDRGIQKWLTAASTQILEQRAIEKTGS